MPIEIRNIIIVSVLVILSSVLFLTLNVHGNWHFILALRLSKLVTLIVVAYSIGVSTLLFQTITNNPILTPSILGFDALYVFLQTLLLATLGSTHYVQLPIEDKFIFELSIMIVGSLLLFQMLLHQGGRDLTRMILIGVIFGILFRSLSSLLQRIIDPEEFAVVQAYTFASFNTVKPQLLLPSSIIVLASSIALWQQRFRLDIYLLGKDQVINLGIPYTYNTLWILMWIALLVATATAMVGPVSFFGLLACAISQYLIPNIKHSLRLPMVFLISALMLIGGQTFFEHILGMKAVLSIVIEFAGGLVFLYLILKHK